MGVRIALSNAQRDEYLKRVPETSTWNEYVFEYLFSLTRLETTDVRSEAHETGDAVARRRFSRLLDPGFSQFLFASTTRSSLSSPQPRARDRPRALGQSRARVPSRGVRRCRPRGRGCGSRSRPSRGARCSSRTSRCASSPPPRRRPPRGSASSPSSPSRPRRRCASRSPADGNPRAENLSAPPPIPADPASRPEACSLTPALTPPPAPPHRPDRACIVFPHRAPPPPPPRLRRSDGSSQPFAVGVRRRGG